MLYQMESKVPAWRALARLDDGKDRPICLGRSAAQVQAGFPLAFLAALSAEERDRARSISLERWEGAPEAGKWVFQADLGVPVAPKMTKSA